MPQFVFRAAAALDLRRQREELAIRARAQAAAALERAECALNGAQSELADVLCRGAGVHDPAQRVWYRNWITRQQREIARRQAMVTDRRVTFEACVANVHATHRDVRALERLQDRMKATWGRAERRREQKELDWLGSVRYALQSRPDEEVT
jgi:flagellar export protein FliJ